MPLDAHFRALVICPTVGAAYFYPDAAALLPALDAAEPCTHPSAAPIQTPAALENAAPHLEGPAIALVHPAIPQPHKQVHKSRSYHHDPTDAGDYDFNNGELIENAPEPHRRPHRYPYWNTPAARHSWLTAITNFPVERTSAEAIQQAWAESHAFAPAPSHTMPPGERQELHDGLSEWNQRLSRHLAALRPRHDPSKKLR
ncbi:hypothetical protein C8R43DRAFT_1134083 [Mycena crocata]|nr:hypothetical protein C8R43DRAFT_1134083 [Mycena crocata]